MQLFTEHPRSVDETYLQHMKNALRYGGSMVASGSACLIHAFFPFLFKTSASDCVFKLYGELRERRDKARP